MTRVALATVLILIAAAVLLVGRLLDPTMTLPGLLQNLGSEIIGIALTVAVIDYLFERKTLREQARSIAWRMLHDIDNGVWTWQGGRREFHLDELGALLNLVTDRDEMAPLTVAAFESMGVRASNALRLQDKLFRAHPPLRTGLTGLAGLSQIRDARSMFTPTSIADCLRDAIAQLARVTGHQVQTGSFGVVKALRDPSLRAQEKRLRIEREERAVPVVAGTGGDDVL